MAKVYPLEHCNFCERDVQRRDNAVNCFWCKKPFGTGPVKPTFEALLASYWQEALLPDLNAVALAVGVCPVCAAVVADKNDHADWHLKVGS